MPLRDIVRYCLKPLGDALRRCSDEASSAASERVFRSTGRGAQKRFGSCGKPDRSMRFAHGENRQGAGISSR